MLFFVLLLGVWPGASHLAAQSVAVATYPMVGEPSSIRVLFSGADGTIWVGARSGLHRLAGGKLIPVQGSEGLGRCSTLGEYSGSLWVGSVEGLTRWTNGRIEVFDSSVVIGLAIQGKFLYYTKFQQRGLWRIDLELCKLGGNCAKELIAPDGGGRLGLGADGRLWFPCGKQVCAISTDRGKDTIERRGEAQGVPPRDWEKCFVDREGSLWAMDALGVFRQAKGEKDLKLIPGMLREASQTDVLHLDADGNALAGSADQIWLGARRKFFSNKDLGLSTSMISSLLGDPSGGIWLGLATGDLLRLKSAGRLTVFTDREGFEFRVFNLVRLEDGSEWSSSKGKLHYLQPGAKAWQTLALGTEKERARLQAAGSRRLIAELASGKLFEVNSDTLQLQPRKVSEVHSEGPAIVLGDGENLVWIRGPKKSPERVSFRLALDNQTYRSYLEDRWGRLWFVTYGGLLAVNEDGTQRLFRRSDGLRMDALQGIALDADNELWIFYDTPSDVSIAKLPPGRIGAETALDFRHIPPSHTGESVFTLGFDNAKRVWKGTELGMLVTDSRQPQPQQWWVMNEEHGLPHPDIVQNSFIRYPVGSFGFSTLKGRVVVSQPEQLFLPGRQLLVNGVLQNGVAKLATMPADASTHAKLQYRSLEWFSDWKQVPSLEFALEPGLTGIEVRVVDNYHFQGRGTLRLGEERVPAALFWFLGVAFAALAWHCNLWEVLRFRWRKSQFFAYPESTAPEIEHLKPGTLLKERFQVTETLARGNFSNVYGAIDTGNGAARVVVKQLRLPEFAGDFSETWLKRRFMQEVGAAGMLRHPGVLPVIEAWIETQVSALATPYLVMRRIEGPTLRSYLNDHGRLETGQALLWLEQLGAVMQEAHSRGIIHCDLKPENLMLENEGQNWRLIVIDFGTSALRLESDVLSQQTRPGGTAAYMAPEQMIGKYSAASDLYSFAAIALEMLTGEKYSDLGISFDEGWESEFLKSLRKLGFPISAARLFVRGLRFDPQLRDQSIDKWLRDLVAALQLE